MFSFYPERGFSSIIFQQVKPGSSPNSLQGFVEQYSDNLKDPQTIVVKPHVIQVGGNDAVEAVSRGDFSLDVSGVGKATGKTIFHTLVLQDKSNFYTCDLQVMEANYKDQLRRLYIDFCASIKFKSN